MSYMKISGNDKKVLRSEIVQKLNQIDNNEILKVLLSKIIDD